MTKSRREIEKFIDEQESDDETSTEVVIERRDTDGNIHKRSVVEL